MLAFADRTGVIKGGDFETEQLALHTIECRFRAGATSQMSESHLGLGEERYNSIDELDRPLDVGQMDRG